jgi:hypothetical protein
MPIIALRPNIKVRIILEDLLEVTAGITETLPEGIGVIAYGYFTEQPIKAAFPQLPKIIIQL